LIGIVMACGSGGSLIGVTLITHEPAVTDTVCDESEQTRQ
jgi:hypothetical protein